MSSDGLAIRARGLGKTYLVRHADRPTTVSEALMSSLRRFRRDKGDPFHALQDVSFDVAAGEIVGIIGGNGAGKSTLLKILSRITEPTTGVAELYGRVGSLLEVGSGFHLELTGRENIYLNGTILGMRRREVSALLDEIVDFAGVEHFLDTPVKRYSSGMYLRLAFAVAAHLNADILLVDEVLAVGDEEFQKKCLGKMNQASKEQGRTLLFVSHNMAAVQAICGRAICISHGQVAYDGPTQGAISAYLDSVPSLAAGTTQGQWDLTQRLSSEGDHLVLRRLRFASGDRDSTDTMALGADLDVVIEVEGLHEVPKAHVWVVITSDVGQSLASFNSGMRPLDAAEARTEREEVRLRIDSLPLTPGRYWVDVGVTNKRDNVSVDVVQRAASFTVLPTDVFGTGYQFSPADGVAYLDATWSVTPQPAASPVR